MVDFTPPTPPKPKPPVNKDNKGAATSGATSTTAQVKPGQERAWWQDVIDAITTPLRMSIGRELAQIEQDKASTARLQERIKQLRAQGKSPQDAAKIAAQESAQKFAKEGNTADNAAQWAASQANAAAPWEGRESKYGTDVLKARGIDTSWATIPKDVWLVGGLDLAGLGVDIAMDPLTYVPGGLIAKPFTVVGGLLKGTTRGAIQATRLQPSAKFVERAPQIADLGKNTRIRSDYRFAPEVPKQVRGAVPNLAKEQSALGALAARNEASRAKWAYVTAPVQGDRSVAQALSQILGSAAEAGLKGAVTAYKESSLKTAVRQANEFNARTVRKYSGKRAKKAGLTMPALSNIGPRAIVPTNEAGNAVIAAGSKKSVELTDLPTLEPVKVAGKIVVQDADGVVYQFADEAGAKAWISDATGLDIADVADVVKFTGKPMMDTAPSLIAVGTTEAVMKAIHPGTAEQAAKSVEAANDIARKTTGTRVGGSALADEVRAIIDPNSVSRAMQFKAAVASDPFIGNMLRDGLSRLDGMDSFQALRILFNSNKPVAKKVAETILRAKVKVGDELVEIQTLFRTPQGKNAIFEQLPASVQVAIEKVIQIMIAGRTAAEIEKAIFAKLSEIPGVGQDIASQIKATGALNLEKATDEGALNAILAKLEGAAGEVKFENAAELIQHVMYGNTSIAPTALMKIAKALSPDAADWKTLSKNLEDPEGIKILQSILASSEVRLTMKSVERRLMLLDADTFAQATNVAMPDVLAGQIDNLTTGSHYTMEGTTVQTSQEAAEKLAKWDADPAKRGRLQGVMEQVSSGLKGRFGYIFDVANEAEVVAKQSALGQAVLKRGDKAILVQDATANFEVNFLGALFQRTGAKNARAVDRTIKSGNKVEAGPELLTDFIERYDMMESAMLATAHVRISHAKAASRLQKGEKPFWAYVNTGDFAKVLRDTGNSDLFNKAFYPYGMVDNITRKGDWLSPIGIGKAITRIMEARQLGAAYKIEDVVADIKSMAKTQTARTAGYNKIVDEIAPQIAKVIEDNIEYFENAHAGRVIAEVEDLRTPTQIYSYEILNTLLQAVELSTKRGTLTTATYQRQALDLMNKFAIAADLFNQSNGAVAEAVMRHTATLFMKLTDMDKVITMARQGILGDSVEVAEQLKAISLVDFSRQNPAMLAHYENLKRAINTYFDWRDPNAELLAIAPRRVVKTVESNLAKAEEAYAAHMRMFPDIANDAKAYKAWEKTYTKLQKDLDAIRTRAIEIGVPTRHYDPRGIDGSPWVPAGSYDAAAVAKAIEDSPWGGAILQASKGDKNALPKDSLPKPKKLTPAQAKKIRKEYLENLGKLNEEKALAQVEQAAENAIDNFAVAERYFPGDKTEQLYWVLQTHFTEPLTQGRIDAIFDDSFVDEFVFGGTTQQAKRMAQGTAPGVERLTMLERAAEAASATSQRAEVGSLANIWEAKIMRGVSDTSAFMDKMITKYSKNLTTEEFSEVVSNAIGKVTREEIANPLVAKASAELGRILDETRNLLAKSKATPASLKAAFRNRGLDGMGLEDVDNYTISELAEALFDKLPIGVRPADEEAAALWDASRKMFDQQKKTKSGLDEFQLLVRVIDAVQFTAGASNMIYDLSARFGWKAAGFASPAAAKRAGWVTPKQIGGKAFQLDVLMPEGVELVLHPTIAKQFAATVRGWNGLFDKPSPVVVRRMMGILSVFKGLQTVVRPGHWVANTMGDSISAMIDGTQPRHFLEGFRLAAKFAGRQVSADYAGGSLGIQRSLERGLESISNVGETLDDLKGLVIEDAAETGGKVYKFVSGDKVIALPEADLARLLEDVNVYVKDNLVNDNANFQHILEGMVGGAETAKMRNMAVRMVNGQTVGATIARGWAKFIKPFGDITAYLGNGIRAAHALKTLESRSWSGVSEMATELNSMINLWHPTIQSLATFERRNVRQYFTYYTWLRGAHSLTLEMFLNHTAAMLVPNKVFFNTAEGNDMEPASIGNLWGDKTKYPSYLDKSLYGPTQMGPNGPMLYKPSVAPMDVMDTWGFGYDPTMAADENAIANVKAAGRTLGSATNLLFQPFLEWLGNVNFKTGRESSVKDFATLGDRFMSDIGPAQLAQGLGLWTPSNKQPDDKYPITPREQEIKRLNYFFGMRVDDVLDPAAEYWAKMDVAEQKRRIKDMIEKKDNK